MSVIVSSAQQISNSPINFSKSKQMYSFPKGRRFNSQHNLSSTQAFYDLPSTKMQRAPSIGYGQKYDFTKSSTRTPAPNTYDQKNMTIAAQEKQGWSFGTSREKMAKHLGSLGGLNLLSPGPGQYKIRSALSLQSYSMASKTPCAELNFTNAKTPGPGTYQVLPSINKTGKYFLSKYKNSGVLQFNPLSSKRFPLSKKDDCPGPGQYPPLQSISKNGKYFYSKYVSSGCCPFTISQRGQLQPGSSKTPGPGQYRLPSEFGYYESKGVAK